MAQPVKIELVLHCEEHGIVKSVTFQLKAYHSLTSVLAVKFLV